MKHLVAAVTQLVGESVDSECVQSEPNEPRDSKWSNCRSSQRGGEDTKHEVRGLAPYGELARLKYMNLQFSREMERMTARTMFKGAKGEHMKRKKEMEELVDKGLSRELASQALAATGAKSTLKATEWILQQRRVDPSKIGGNASRAQTKMDHFFQGNAPVRAVAGPSAPQADSPADASSSDAHLQQVDEEDAGGIRGMDDRERWAVGGPGASGFEIGGNKGWRNLNSSPLDKGRAEQEDMGSFAGGFKVVEPPRIVARPSLVGTAIIGRPAEGSGQASNFPAAAAMYKNTPGSGAIQEGAASGTKRPRPGDEENPSKKRTPSAAAPPFFSPKLAQSTSKAKQNEGSKTGKSANLPPLAERMRPATIDEVVGQDQILGPKQMLRALLENDTVPSIILYGPPGTGKTSLARAIARSVPSIKYVGLSAVNTGVKEVKVILEEAKKKKKHGTRTLLFLDEIHRFNKAQQDLFLPYIEAGHIIFVGATTENPSFEINAALLSRCRTLTLNKLQPEHLIEVLERAVMDRKRGIYASLPERVTAEDVIINVEEEALRFLAGAADGDARVALNALEIATAAAISEAKHHKRNQQAAELTLTGASSRSFLDRDRSGVVSGSGPKKDYGGHSIFGSDRERASTGFGAKRFEALIENAKDPHAIEEYTKPFKRFVGGRDMTPVLTAVRLEREREVSVSSCDAEKELTDRGEPASCKVPGDNPDAALGEGEQLEKVGELLVTVSSAQVRDALQRSHVLYDKDGEEHYNIISALHKSMRGSDADAAIYWLARMLEGGEGPLYVARRLVRFASEDVGVADPNALVVAVACYQACHFLGMPECNVNLAQCVVYLALAPKSVITYQAIEAAQKLVRESEHNEPVPLHLRNAPTRLMSEMGYGKGYIYPPSQTGRVEQDYMPPSLQGHKFLNWQDS
ncbi:hypothetical protein R1sor_006808 [Riccia sorocarpa]|uniref:UBA domain-containing protein n=1 Tax=Riccia sorocarpa TaxID=122646 RepID=A0ABD3HRI3_9MARC